uniref:Uncharacterized protein n=1 Tax=Arundo donax TaxID=35708 RepID=A0A0A8XR77_ARUDO
MFNSFRGHATIANHTRTFRASHIHLKWLLSLRRTFWTNDTNQVQQITRLLHVSSDELKLN